MEKLLSLENKIALVTGGSQGIGLAISKTLAKAGAHVVINGQNPDRANSAAEEVNKNYGRASVALGNVSDPDVVKEIVKGVVKEFGSLDVLVNNAGITKDNLLMRMSDEQWNDVISINLTGSFNCVRAVTRPMMKQRSGVIINITSVVGVMGNAGQVNYSASKAGMIGMTKATAKELAPRGIRVNAIAPGFIRTAMTDKLDEDVQTAYKSSIPLSRFGEPEEVANLVLFLAADTGAYITGQVLNVDGGLVI